MPLDLLADYRTHENLVRTWSVGTGRRLGLRGGGGQTQAGHKRQRSEQAGCRREKIVTKTADYVTYRRRDMTVSLARRAQARTVACTLGLPQAAAGGR